MRPSVFTTFKNIAYEKAGIELRPGKETLVEARVGKRLRELGINDLKEYLKYLNDDQSGEELVHFLDAISTNFTSFFREPDHFDVLRESIGMRVAAGAKKVRIWCAASSSGEEPYTMAMVIEEAFANSGVDIKILATDISTKVLARAREGMYGSKQLSTVPKHLLSKYFTPGKKDKDGDSVFRVNDVLKRRIAFERLNLATPPFPMAGPLDVVMCRNVMIYFDSIVRQRLVDEITRLLRPGGVLMLGHSETLSGLQTPNLKPQRASVYEKLGG